MAVLVAAVVGLVAGFAVSIPPTGPVALLELRGALLGRHRGTVLLSVGSAITDVPYVLLAALGYAWVVQGNAGASIAFDLGGALILGAIGWRLARDARAPTPRTADDQDWTGFRPLLEGVALGIANPTRMLTWAVVASVVAPVLPESTLPVWTAFALAVAAGEVAWTVVQVAAWRALASWKAGIERRLLAAGAVVAWLGAGWLVVRAVAAIAAGP